MDSTLTTMEFFIFREVNSDIPQKRKQTSVGKIRCLQRKSKRYISEDEKLFETCQVITHYGAIHFYRVCIAGYSTVYVLVLSCRYFD